ncbi:serine hydrolase domain-containing protein [Vibrio caribbeanicus]|uniref:Beta-lactamase n=1 Tax=Vibrio caribbeanicus ATCC BAA-2122 TaxID=796620 RepID=E3BPG6_9VIBR|nr:serine hydrolase domain-containing protein [Vibrio caribbeanicus]EFP95055.1 beta-lactamase [Vibrio caribbeanicus ATCC BAA-2122]
MKYSSGLVQFGISASLLLCLPLSYVSATEEDREKNALKSISIEVNGKVDSVDLRSAMAHYKVPAISFAVINDDKVVWSEAIGYVNASHSQEVDVNTLFQAGSISKSVAATTALNLVEQGLISLDENVDSFLGDWHIPNPHHYKSDVVTLRELLSMSSGLDVGGYYGYAPGEPLPSLLDTLNGAAPAKNPPVMLAHKPGSKYEYSGGGYEVVQLITDNITKMTSQESTAKFVFDPLKMSNSSYDQPSGQSLKNVAEATDSDGKEFEYKWRVSPEYAAAGMWSTPTDLGKFIVSINKAYKGEKKQVLSPRLAKQSLSKQKNTPYGLGFVVRGKGEKLHFMKLGQNSGYQSWLVGLPNTRQGAVVMTNSDNGRELAQDLIYSISKAYHWPIRGKLEDAWMVN